MKTEDTASDTSQPEINRPSHVASFAKALDGRKQPIRGLWIRNGRFYAQLTIEDPITGQKKVRRVALADDEDKPVATVAAAVDRMERLKDKRDDDDLPTLGRTPTFTQYADDYLRYIKTGAGTKKPATVAKEETHLKGWKAHLGAIRLNKIRPVHVSAFIRKRLEKNISRRTIKLDVIVLRNVLKRARDVDAHIRALPIPPGLNAELKSATPKRPLFTHDMLETLCAAATGTKKNKQGKRAPLTKNSTLFVDYVRLLAFSGARRNEALALRWDDVDFDRGQLTIGATGDTKNSTARVVDFNPRLRAHLEDMKKRYRDVSTWLFPSPQRGQKDIHVATFKESLNLVRERAEMPTIGFHDLRHYFISYAVMSGVDFMTIARWVGHRDGGILIGKVYGHLADDHAKAQALRLNFGPVVLEKAG